MNLLQLVGLEPTHNTKKILNSKQKAKNLSISRLFDESVGIQTLDFCAANTALSHFAIFYP